MSILRYLNKHHGWYDGKRTPFGGPEATVAAPLLLEAIEGGAAVEGAGALGAAAAAEGAGYGALAAEGAYGLGEGAAYGAEAYAPAYAEGVASEGTAAAQESARQAAIQNAGNSALHNVPVSEMNPGMQQVGTNATNFSDLAHQGQTLTDQGWVSNGVENGLQQTGTNVKNLQEGQLVVNQVYSNGQLMPYSEYAKAQGFASTQLPSSLVGAEQPSGIGGFLKEYQTPLMVGSGLYALNGMMNQDRNRYGVPTTQPYSGPLSKLNYDPSTYNYTAPVSTPYAPNYSGYARSRYAEGGITGLDRNFAAGGQDRQTTMGSYSPLIDQSTGEPVANMASGGIAGLLNGRGDGMSDSIKATIANKQPARLADGEFVVPADVVSHLGNGSTDAGAKHLYKMMDKVRRARTGTKKQGKQINAGGYLPIK